MLKQLIRRYFNSCVFLSPDSMPQCCYDAPAREASLPGCPVAKSLHFRCRGCKFDPWSGSYGPTCHVLWPKEKQNKIKLAICLKSDVPRRDRPVQHLPLGVSNSHWQIIINRSLMCKNKPWSFMW